MKRNAKVYTVQQLVLLLKMKNIVPKKIYLIQVFEKFDIRKSC